MGNPYDMGYGLNWLKFLALILLELVFLDTNGNVVPMMNLTEKTMVEWINEIICFISRKNE